MSRLPPPPDFETLAHAAEPAAREREQVLALIGTMSFSWSNNESLLIYVLMLLMRTEQAIAAVVFATLNTTRARIDLINRLALMRSLDKATSGDLETIIDQFNRLTRVRNELNHSMFVLNERGEFSHTLSMRLEERRGRLRFGARRDFDEARLRGLREAVADLAQLNRDLWAFLPRLEEAVQRSGPEGAGPERAGPRGGPGPG